MARLHNGQAGKGLTADWLHGGAQNVAVTLPQRGSDPKERCPCSNGSHPRIDPAAGLFLDFGAGRCFMRLLAFRRVELIDVEAASICCNAAGGCRCSCHVSARHLSGCAVYLRHKNNFRAEGFKHPGALRTVPGGHGDDERMPQHGAGDSKARAHVAARHFDYWRARLQATI